MTNHIYNSKKQLFLYYKLFREEIKNFLPSEIKLPNFFIAGGAVGSVLRGERPNDIDLYCVDLDEIISLRQQILSSYGYSELEPKETIQTVCCSNKKKGYQPGELICFTKNSLTFKGSQCNYQIITRYAGETTTVLDNFDFIHTMIAYNDSSNKLIYGNLYDNEIIMSSILKQQLVYHHSEYPVSSLFRLKKYVERGYDINVTSLVKLCFDISLLDLTKPEVLQEQLTGLDMVILSNLINKFSSINIIDRTIIDDVIDEIMNRTFEVDNDLEF